MSDEYHRSNAIDYDRGTFDESNATTTIEVERLSATWEVMIQTDCHRCTVLLF